MSELKSYKIPSKVTNIIVFLAAFIVYIGREGLLQILPEQLAYLAPIIVLLAGYIATQKTEDKRVDVAEQLAVENHMNQYKEEYETPEVEDIEVEEEDAC